MSLATVNQEAFGTTNDYLNALLALKKEGIHQRHIDLLQAHLSAPNHTATWAQLAKTVGYATGNAVNLQYGTFAKRVAEKLGINEPPSGFWLYVLASWANQRDPVTDHTAFVLRPEVIEALTRLGILTRGEMTIAPQGGIDASERTGILRDPFSVPMIFLRIGWMNRYRGKTVNDQITGGGAFVREHGFGHEIVNFKPFKGKMYGYVQPPGTGYNQAAGPGINIRSLGASPGDESISDVLVIWVATAPQGGSVVVGWYENATVYRHWQASPPGANRAHGGDEFGYYVTADENDATLLRKHERLFPIPRGKGGMGQANVWYANDPNEHRQIREKILRYISQREIPKPTQGSGGVPRQVDPFVRQKIEQAAIAFTLKHYADLGFLVNSVESDNLGWDLEAEHFSRQLRQKIEVKGLSGSEKRIELTPNEYSKMKLHCDSYHVCVVTEALAAPRLTIFAYSEDSDHWEDENGQVLQIEEIVGARCRAN
jgi:hypothetical protein